MNMLNKLPLVSNLKGFKLAYAVARNKAALTAESKLLEDARKPSEAFILYNKERIELCKELAEKEENGKPKIVHGAYVGVEDHPDWDERFGALEDKHREAVDAHDKMIVDYNEALETEIDFEMYMIGVDQIPEDITVAQMDAIMLMIRDHDGKIDKAEPVPRVPEEPPE